MTPFEIVIIFAILLFAYALGQIRLSIRRMRKEIVFPDCNHKSWKIDTQIKVVWCEECKRGRWYQVASILGRQINVETVTK